MFMHCLKATIRLAKDTHTPTHSSMSYIVKSDIDVIRDLEGGGRVVSGGTVSDMAALG